MGTIQRNVAFTVHYDVNNLSDPDKRTCCAE
jgi:hypothetical protein